MQAHFIRPPGNGNLDWTAVLRGWRRVVRKDPSVVETAASNWAVPEVGCPLSVTFVDEVDVDALLRL
jgi:sugar phosphate isomerase/epimerase